MLNIARTDICQKSDRSSIDTKRDQLKATPEQSDRQIAKSLGVDKNTVNTQRKDMESTGEIHQFETNIGADGKERPRKVTRKPVSVFNPTKREERAMDFS